jgi:hypothetical protein
MIRGVAAFFGGDRDVVRGGRQRQEEEQFKYQSVEGQDMLL